MTDWQNKPVSWERFYYSRYRRGGQVVGVLAFYSDDSSSYNTKAYSFSDKFGFEKSIEKEDFMIKFMSK